jgi:hypothetical protein
MMQTLPWIVALAALAVLGLGLAAWLQTARRPKRQATLPLEWRLARRPVFSNDERRAYRLLREAFPHHVLLSKLPLVRFCQPTDPNETRYWYDLLGALHITFAVCSANGRVIAAIDLGADSGRSRRALQIKQSVLGACQVRYLRCALDQLPSMTELQLLVPQAPSRAPQPSRSAAPGDLRQASDSLASTVAIRRAERTVLWQESNLFQDSFFAPDSRQDSVSGAELRPEIHVDAAHNDDVAGIVVDTPQYARAIY